MPESRRFTDGLVGRLGLTDGLHDPTAEDLAEPVPTWGLGEVALGWILGMAAAAVITIITVAALGYSLTAPSGEGSAVGQVVRDLGTGSMPTVEIPVPIAVSALLQVPLWIGLLGVPYLACRFKGRGIVRDLRLRFRWIDVPLGIVVGVGTQIVLIPILYWVLFKFIGDQDISEEARKLTGRATSSFGVLVLLAIVGIGAPIAEEIFFRGFTDRALEKRGMSWILATVITAVVFGVTHGQPLQFPALALFGLILGVIVHITGRLGPAIVAHAAFNITAAVLLVWG